MPGILAEEAIRKLAEKISGLTYTPRREYFQAEVEAELHRALDPLLAFIKKQHGETNCICRIKGSLKGTHLETDLECTKCEAYKLLAALSHPQESK